MSDIDSTESWWKRSRTRLILRYRQYRPLVWVLGCIAAALVLVAGYEFWGQDHSGLPLTGLGPSQESAGPVTQPRAVLAPPAAAPSAEPAPSPVSVAQAAEPAKAAPVKRAKKLQTARQAVHPKRVSPVEKNAKGEYVWRHFGAAPYAPNRAEAMRTRESAFRALGFPNEAVKELVRATEMPGERIRLTNGYRLSAMLSKGSVVHRNVVVDFIKPPINGKMEYAAPAEMWQVVWKGQTYTVILPDICNNWSRRDTIPTAPRLSIGPSECRTVAYAVNPGDLVRFAVLAQKRLPASACWQLCDGTDCAAPPSPCDDCDWIGPKSVIPDGFEPLHTGRYVAKHSKQTLRLPLEVSASYVALCDDRPGLGDSDSWIVQPREWRRGITTIIVPYGGQQWPAWGQVDMSKWR